MIFIFSAALSEFWSGIFFFHPRAIVPSFRTVCILLRTDSTIHTVHTVRYSPSLESCNLGMKGRRARLNLGGNDHSCGSGKIIQHFCLLFSRGTLARGFSPARIPFGDSPTPFFQPLKLDMMR